MHTGKDEAPLPNSFLKGKNFLDFAVIKKKGDRKY